MIWVWVLIIVVLSIIGLVVFIGFNSKRVEMPDIPSWFFDDESDKGSA